MRHEKMEDPFFGKFISQFSLNMIRYKMKTPAVCRQGYFFLECHNKWLLIENQLLSTRFAPSRFTPAMSSSISVVMDFGRSSG